MQKDARRLAIDKTLSRGVAWLNALCSCDFLRGEPSEADEFDKAHESGWSAATKRPLIAGLIRR